LVLKSHHVYASDWGRKFSESAVGNIFGNRDAGAGSLGIAVLHDDYPGHAISLLSHTPGTSGQYRIVETGEGAGKRPKEVTERFVEDKDW
jgi:hypothetical protein